MLSSVTRKMFRTSFARGFKTSTPLSIKVGEKIPSVPLKFDAPTEDFSLVDELKGSKAVIVGVPGAFSSGCSQVHVPGYLSSLPKFADKGYSKLFVVSVNDVFVMQAWASSLPDFPANNENVKLLADPSGEFVSALDLKFDASKFFGNERSKRFALLVDDGTVTHTFVEPSNTAIEVSEAGKVLSEI